MAMANGSKRSILSGTDAAQNLISAMAVSRNEAEDRFSDNLFGAIATQSSAALSNSE
jgi:hypothetical protein